MEDVSAMENSMVKPQKIKHVITVCSRNSTSRYIPKRTGSRDLNRFSYTLSSYQYHSQVEVTSVLLNSVVTAAMKLRDACSLEEKL